MGKVTLDDDVLGKWVQRIVKAETEKEEALKKTRQLKVELVDDGYINIEVSARVSITEEMIMSLDETLGREVMLSSIIEKLAALLAAQVLSRLEGWKRGNRK